MGSDMTVDTVVLPPYRLMETVGVVVEVTHWINSDNQYS